MKGLHCQCTKVSEAKMLPWAFLPGAVIQLRWPLVAINLVTGFEATWSWQCWLLASWRFQSSANTICSAMQTCWFIFTHPVYSRSLNLLTDINAYSWVCIWWGRKLCIRRGQGHVMESHLWESTELLGSELLVPRTSTAATVCSFCNPRS